MLRYHIKQVFISAGLDGFSEISSSQTLHAARFGGVASIKLILLMYAQVARSDGSRSCGLMPSWPSSRSSLGGLGAKDQRERLQYGVHAGADTDH